MSMPFACSITARRPKRLAGRGTREPAQGDVDRALQLLGPGLDDVGEDAALGGLAHVGGVLPGSTRHGAGGLVHDLVDQT